MRLRQAVWVARDLEAVSADLEHATGVREPFHDPAVAVFGLRNAVYALGDTFLEIVSPMQAGTTAGRYLDRRDGDGGYMLIVQIDDFEDARARAEKLGIRTVWTAELPDIRAAHLHPKDTGGALLSIDQPDPPASWRWGGPDWEGRSAQGTLDVVEIQSDDPGSLASRWSELLGRDLTDLSIELDAGTIRFVEATDGRGDGLGGIDVTVPSQKSRLVSLGGLRLEVSGAG